MAPIRNAELVGDDAQLLTLTREATDSQQKILATEPVDPARAQHEAWSAACKNGLFTMQLAAAVCIDRIRRCIFPIGLGGSAVEYVVGRIMDEQRPETLGFFGEDFGSMRVDRLGLFRLLLGPIHSGIGGSVDDQCRPQGTYRRSYRFGIFELELRAIERRDVTVSRKQSRQLEPELTQRAGNQDLRPCHCATGRDPPTRVVA